MNESVRKPPTRAPISLSWSLSLEVPERKMAKKKSKKEDISDSNTGIGGSSRRRRKKKILDGVYGTVEPGQLLAIMGASGAGKTSMLNCISMRNKNFSGAVLHNGVAMPPTHIAKVSSYVQQEDLFIPTLSPLEHLTFAAVMRMDRRIPYADKKAKAWSLLKDLELTKCANTLIGGAGSSVKGISGGEKKRLSFASEILSDPSLLFVDEPISGLDSFTAEMVISKLASLAAAGRTIIATVHQPSSTVFSQFSHLLLLAEGRIAYFGPTDGALEHFDRLGHPVPSHFNPADYYIRLLHMPAPDEEEDNKEAETALQTVISILDAYPDSQAGREAAAKLPKSLAIAHASARDLESSGNFSSPNINSANGSARNGTYKVLDAAVVSPEGQPGADVEIGGTNGVAANGSQGGEIELIRGASWFTQLRYLYHRTLLLYAREPVLTRARLAQVIVVALIVGLIYWNVGKTQNDVQDIIGLLFFITLNQAILGCIGVLQVFPLEMPIFLREHSSGMYRTDVFFLGRTLAELPFQILFPAIFGCIIFFMSGLPINAALFFEYEMFIVLASNAAISLGYCISALTRSVGVALALGPVALMPLVLLGGLLTNQNSLPSFFVWVSYISFIKYGYEGISIAVWSRMGDLDCTQQIAEGKRCTYPTGDDVLNFLGFNPDHLWRNAIALLGLIFAFRLLAFTALVYRTRKSEVN